MYTPRVRSDVLITSMRRSESGGSLALQSAAVVRDRTTSAGYYSSRNALVVYATCSHQHRCAENQGDVQFPTVIA